MVLVDKKIPENEKRIPVDWKTSEAIVRGNYIELKLLEQVMKVFERNIEQKIRENDRYR